MLKKYYTASILLACFTLAACDQNGPTGPGVESEQTITVNAATNWAYLSVTGASASELTLADAGSNPLWDIAFNATSVRLNGGASGPGGVTGYCLCRTAKDTASLRAMTAANQLAAFNAVTAADVPADSAFKSDALAPAISGWWSYNPIAHTVTANSGRLFLVRTADGNSWAKLRVISIANATQTTAGTVTIEYAVQSAKGAALGGTQTATFDVPASGSVTFDLQTGAVGSAGWDISFSGYDIRVNGGVSGSGSAAALAMDAPFASVTDPSAPPATTFRTDGFGGVFEAQRWYRYNITGSDNQIWPTFDVYLIKRGSQVFKLQLINYYGANGEARQITLRYAKVSG